jgi:hypothetical protein
VIRRVIVRAVERAARLISRPVYATYLSAHDWSYRLTPWRAASRTTVTAYAPLPANRIALLATQGGSRLAPAITTLIDAVRAENASVVLVVNGRLSDSLRTALADRVAVLIERPPVGRDFGGYQAGIAYLARCGIVAERLLVANDSMFYDRLKTAAMIQRFFSEPGDVLAATESHDPAYHIASFIFAVSGNVQVSAAWRRYWRRYKPSSSRPATIARGELGLSKALFRDGGFTPVVFYTVADVARTARTWSADDLAQRLPMMPTEFRKTVRAALLEKGMRFKSARPVHCNRLLDELFTLMERRSQVHWCGFLMNECLGMPIVKKDLAFRELYAMNELVGLGQALGYPDMEEFQGEVRRRGIPQSMGLWKRSLYRAGYI